MTPEGSSPECPSCLRSGTFTLHAFDTEENPGDKQLGIQIPLFKHNDELHSIWITYRGGIKDAAKGVGVHHAWQSGLNGYYGSAYDSVNYDAYGDTLTRADSFITPGTTFVVPPTYAAMTKDIASAVQVTPVVEVESVTKGVSARVKVAFLESGTSAPTQLPDAYLGAVSELQCDTIGTGTFSKSLEGRPEYIVHIQVCSHTLPRSHPSRVGDLCGHRSPSEAAGGG